MNKQQQTKTLCALRGHSETTRTEQGMPFSSVEMILDCMSLTP